MKSLQHAVIEITAFVKTRYATVTVKNKDVPTINSVEVQEAYIDIMLSSIETESRAVSCAVVISSDLDRTSIVSIDAKCRRRVVGRGETNCLGALTEANFACPSEHLIQALLFGTSLSSPTEFSASPASSSSTAYILPTSSST
ncbi:hypothetical protein ElyMa_003276400 [Elysia marginata]|uniref:Uncharacterized protein n=1 Tax=Elysia marginata TaxID=1093978 RepID=A0AAV4JEI0_9GAST|nr:hypothetical protein ElyMa_003276400 [Elysia marginata]